MNSEMTRRTFVKHIGYAGAVLPAVAPALVRGAGANSRVNIAGIGVGGRGFSDLGSISRDKLANIVALCDVDLRRTERAGIGKAAEAHPSAKTYQDWRRLLEASGDIDAVFIATPDHMHAPITLAALTLGKHVYCEKPLTHDIHEARVITQAAAAHPKLVTQLGNQGHSSAGYRMVVQMIQAGVIGKVKEVHAWCNKPIPWVIYPKRPQGQAPTPAEFNWDIWLGTAPQRPYLPEVYHPFDWRNWKDFGSAMQGDMGCHILDPVVWSLGLGPPKAITVQCPQPYRETYVPWRISRYEFSPTQYTVNKTLSVTWYDGSHYPPIELAQMPAGRRLPDQGSMFIGAEGVLIIQHAPTAPMLYPEEKFRGYPRPKLDPIDHHSQWVQACAGNGSTGSHFGYGGPLTETALLGTIGERFPNERLEFDSPKIAFTNKPEANAFLRRTYRKGWEAQGL